MHLDPAIIERLYETFGRYRAQHLQGCPCRTSEEHSRKLVEVPLRKLTADRLEAYAPKAMTTWGTVDEYKHFLPRIFELTFAGELTCHLEITFSKLAYGQFDNWPAHERETMERFALEVWSEAVKLGDVEIADSIFCGAAKFMSVQGLLEHALVLTWAYGDAPDLRS